MQCEELTKDELFALNRDGLYRENQDGLANGFFAVWPFMLFVIAAASLVIAIISFFGYATGLCRSPHVRVQTSLVE